MEPKKALISKATPRIKEAPDGRVYLTKSGERVRITKCKMFPVHPSDTGWRKELAEQANTRFGVTRISDGHELWGYTVDDLTLEA